MIYLGFYFESTKRKIMIANRSSSLPMYFIFLFDMYLLLLSSAYEPAYGMILDCNSSTPAVPITWSPQRLFNSKLSTVIIDSSEDAGNPPENIFVGIFHTEFTYTSSVCPGTKFIRLHFYPTSYAGLKISKALFSVSIGQYTLLTTSESSYSKHASDLEYIIKEYCVQVDGQILNITFTPLNKPGAYAFVNKIEIVSVPSNLYVRATVPLPLIEHFQNFYIEPSKSLETMYRVNVGGNSIPDTLDSVSGMFRAWSGDNIYLISDEKDTGTLRSKAKIKYSSRVPDYTAPKKVYATARTINPKGSIAQGGFSMTWSFPIEYGFYYLIRLHFCEITTKITRRNQRVFQVYINDQIAEDHADVIQWSGGDLLPIYRDYVVDLSEPEVDHLRIELRSISGLARPYGQAILNGLEILKLSDTTNSLAGARPYGFGARRFSLAENDGIASWLPAGLLIGFFAITLASLVGLCIPLKCCPRFARQNKTFVLWQSDQLRHFSLPEIKSATYNFSDSLLIGAGGFGKVYKGSIDCGTATVAIKRANPCSNQGLNEFKTEISMLSNLQHCHLVSLIGHCMENKEMILVYDYMSRGTLRDHLYNNHKPPLEWKRRLKICIGFARGLHYLHTGAKHTIIHRDVKSTNILLDENWVAKVSDFGLSKIGPNMLTQSNTHVSTVVKGSFGYLDPEYYRRRKLTEKSDVYSFGVVLFEVLCARPAVLPIVDNEEEDQEKVNLGEWALRCYQSGALDTIIDPYLRGKIDPGCFKTFTDIAMKCLADRGCDRPNMGDVLWNLEVSWQQQEAADEGKNTTTYSSLKIDDHPCICFGNSDQTPGVEFSEFMVTIGR